MSKEKFYQEHNFEDAIEAYLTEYGGYKRLPSEAFDPNPGIFPNEVIEFVKETQPDKWEELEEVHDNPRKRFLSELEGALERKESGPLDLLRHGLRTTGMNIDLAYFKPETGLNPVLREKYEANRLGVTRQLYYSDETQQSVDLALIINGIPVATAELKNPMTDQTVEHAKEQYKQDRDPSEPLIEFTRGALVHFAVDSERVEYTTEIKGGDTDFLPFNKGHDGGAGNPPNEEGHRTTYLWEDVWAKDSWLDIIRRFMHLNTEEVRENGRVVETKETMIFPRYHQLDCVRKLVDAARENGPGKDYLIQHSTGSGKSKSIGWLAHRFVSLHNEDDEEVFDGVVVVTDRRILDDQLRRTIYDIDHTKGVVKGIKGEGQSKSQELADALDAGKDVIIVTLQTFPYVIEHTASLPERDYAVIVDEAHSSQTGEMAKEMKEILSGIEIDEDEDVDWEDLLAESAEARGPQDNLSFFAFTATPKGKTLETFGEPIEGEDRKEPFHVYPMRQAIEEGFILDVLQNYTTYDTYYNIVKQTEQDPQLPEQKTKKAIKEYLEEHPHNIQRKSETIVEHFRNHTRQKIGGKAKAMVITRSRKAAIRYTKAIRKYVDEQGYDGVDSLVAFSDTVEVDGVEYTESDMNGFSQSELPSKFSTPHYQLLVVADKYQTGFDEPLLHTMYVDKKLSGVQAVQTLGRLNRTAPGKDDTFVLDFVNDREDIEDAFQLFYERTTTEGSIDPQHIYQLESELERFPVFTSEQVDEFAAAYFSPENTGTEQAHAELSKQLQEPVDRFKAITEEEKEEFKSKLRDYIRLYKFQSQVVDYTDTDLEKLYIFGRFLAKQLPRDTQDPTLNIEDDLALRYYRLEQADTEEITLEESSGEVSVPTDTGTRSQEEDEVSLSQLVDRLNEALGTDFTAADELFLQQVKEDALEDEELQKAAQVNSRSNFSYAFDDKLTELFINRMDENQDLFVKFMEDDELQNLVTRLLREEVYEAHQQSA